MTMKCVEQKSCLNLIRFNCHNICIFICFKTYTLVTLFDESTKSDKTCTINAVAIPAAHRAGDRQAEGIVGAGVDSAGVPGDRGYRAGTGRQCGAEVHEVITHQEA